MCGALAEWNARSIGCLPDHDSVSFTDAPASLDDHLAGCSLTVLADAGVLVAAVPLSLAGSGIEGTVLVALLSSFGVELAVSMFFSPLTMDGPLGASVSPDPEVPAAASLSASVVALRTEPSTIALN